MQTFRLEDDDKHLYFKNIDEYSEREIRAEVISILTQNGCVISEKVSCPDCDLYPCKINDIRFAVCISDNEGVSICVDDADSLNKIEQLFA